MYEHQEFRPFLSEGGDLLLKNLRRLVCERFPAQASSVLFITLEYMITTASRILFYEVDLLLPWKAFSAADQEASCARVPIPYGRSIVIKDGKHS